MPDLMDAHLNSAGMGSLRRWRGWTASFVFPVIPRGDVDFVVTTHQLMAWLMDRSHLQPSEPDLPDGFWQWLLMERGDASEQA